MWSTSHKGVCPVSLQLYLNYIVLDDELPAAASLSFKPTFKSVWAHNISVAQTLPPESSPTGMARLWRTSLCHGPQRLSPEGLPFGREVRVPVTFVGFKQDRHQLFCEVSYLLFTQLVVFFHQSCDKENGCCNFIPHGSRERRRSATIKRKRG